MLSQFHLLITVLLSTLFQATTLASPVPTSSSTALHTCSVYVQLWVAADNIFDVYVFPEACPNNECIPIAEVETTQPVPAGGELPDSGPGGVSGNVGSFPLHIFNTIPPANNNVGGELSFSWGTESWNTNSAGCIVTPVTDAGAAVGGATTYYCPFQCDA